MCELHQKLKKMYLCNIFKVCSFWSLLKHKPKELLSWFHITNLAGPFPAPKLDKNPSPQKCDYFTAQPSHDFFSPIPLTHTEQELSAAFLKCSRITFPVIQWTSSGNWCSWKQTSFPTVQQCRWLGKVKKKIESVSRSGGGTGRTAASCSSASSRHSSELELLLHELQKLWF